MKVIESLSDVNGVFSLTDAAARGYRVQLHGDGRALVTSGEGTEYHLHNFTCDCQDALFRDGGSYELPTGRRACKHVLLVLQARPCEWCEGTMVLEADGRYFHCLLCQAPFDARLVREERREALSGACGEVRTPGLPPEPQMADDDIEEELKRLAMEDVEAGIDAAAGLPGCWTNGTRRWRGGCDCAEERLYRSRIERRGCPVIRGPVRV